MTTKADFNGEEWMKVSTLPGLVIISAAMSDGKMMPSVREVTAGGETLTKAAAARSDIPLLTELVGDASPKLDLGEEKPASAEAALTILEAQITEAWAVLVAHVDADELVAVRQTLTDVAQAVVARIGTGFMGSGDEKVSPTEQAYVDRLVAILA
jgi:hypothetical protein